VKEVAQSGKETIIKIQEIESKNNLPTNSLVIPILLLAFLILVLITMYCVYYINKFKNYIKRKLYITEESIAKDFKALEEDTEKEILISHKIQTNEKLTEEEIASLDKFRKDVKESKESIIKEIKDIEDNS
jgi:septal ring factor EnvC (AmiA/AmiB activator)